MPTRTRASASSPWSPASTEAGEGRRQLCRLFILVERRCIRVVIVRSNATKQSRGVRGEGPWIASAVALRAMADKSLRSQCERRELSFLINFSNSRHVIAFSRRHLRPSFALWTALEIAEGAGKAGCRPHPWSACNKKHAAEPQAWPNIRPSLRDRFTAYTYSPRCAGLVSHRRHPKSSPGQLSASVGAPGPYDFAVLPRLFVCPRHRAPTRTSPSHPTPRVVTIAMRPSCRGGTAPENINF
jgi:hypothetical protein